MASLVFRLLVAAAFVAVVAISARQPTVLLSKDSRLILPRPELLRALGRSHIQLVTDFYWLRALNRATTASTEADGKALLSLGWLITDLDPKLMQAYWVAALNATLPPPNTGDVWLNATEAAALLERGVEMHPLENKLTIVLAQTHISYMHDMVGAAAVLERRAKLPGALPHFGPLAIRILATTGHYEAGRELARAMLESATDEDTRKLFEERLKLIDLEEQLTVVDAAAKRYIAEHGNAVFDVADLLRSGLLIAEPIDPFGGAIIIKDGRAYSTAVQRLEVHQ